MEEGYIADYSSGSFLEQFWYPGRPAKSFWTGLKLPTDQRVAVNTFRCSKCGYLESYAK
jgi:hypothetical protein